MDLLNPATAAHGQAQRGLKLKWSRERDFYVDNLFVEEVADDCPRRLHDQRLDAKPTRGREEV